MVDLAVRVRKSTTSC